MNQLEVTQIRSSIKQLKKQKQTLEALGLRGISKKVIHNDTHNIRGMIAKVTHLVEVKEIKKSKA